MPFTSPRPVAQAAGPVRLGPDACSVLRPAVAASITGGFWHRRRRVNAEVGIPQGPALLESAGNLHDLRLAAGTAVGEFRGDYPFMDSDVYKWLEAASWQLGQDRTGDLRRDAATGPAAGAAPASNAAVAPGADPRSEGTVAAVAPGAGPRPEEAVALVGPGASGSGPQSDAALAAVSSGDGSATARLSEQVDRIIALVAAAQHPDGYLNTWFQVTKGGRRYQDLRWGHELYCAGHLIQAAVAHHRATGSKDLLGVATRFADHIDSVFGEGKRIDGVDGHPQIETALVELYRETGEVRYRDLAAYFVDRRGQGLLGGEAYCQDRVPLREAENVEGHAVRQLYLLAAAADLAIETGEAGLATAGERLWHAMVATKTHLTGGLGAHHDEEDFGDPFELPNERAYCETCAAVASVHWSWRLALLTGRARYSDLVERTLYNGFLAGVSLDGERWLYVNPLQVRDGHTDTGGDHSARRTRWFRCACCPPNVMRLLASLEHYVASSDATGLQLHQYATGRYEGDAGGRRLVVSTETAYPLDGTVTITVEETPTDGPWTLSLRIPQWCPSFAVRAARTAGSGGAEGVPGGRDACTEDGWLRLERVWAPGDRIVLELDLAPRLTRADPRVDAVRGCVALERGPLVHCLEETDHPGGGLDDVVIDAAAQPATEFRPDLLGGVPVVVASGRRRAAPRSGTWWPYQDGGSPFAGDPAEDGGEPLRLTAVPYYAWANREDGAMRVWIPTD
ncbi:beta-L-arabinofuranosidase domain-containing protein [Streptomyces sp. NPDC004528]|uniref:glycoside hydrolase family 127 protein n=1 Tax=Streptomyces sp. NPDC004528 TaxID=3154550 RepID=UPI0033A044BD